MDRAENFPSASCEGTRRMLYVGPDPTYNMSWLEAVTGAEAEYAGGRNWIG